jgi:hypothetical protein
MAIPLLHSRTMNQDNYQTRGANLEWDGKHFTLVVPFRTVALHKNFNAAVERV